MRPRACVSMAACALQDVVVEALRKIEGVEIAQPQGAFYALPDCSAFCGPESHAEGFGRIPDDEALCR